MSKYSDLIKEARKAEQQIELKKTSAKTAKPREKENNISRIIENNSQPNTIPSREEKLAGISIKVPENLRRHWVVEAKRTGKSMTSVIIEALNKEFGKP